MFKECLRVRCDHATPTFPDFKAYVYRREGIRLQEERHTFTGEKAYVYRKEAYVYRKEAVAL